MGSSVPTLPYWLNNKKEANQPTQTQTTLFWQQNAVLLPVPVCEPRQGSWGSHRGSGMVREVQGRLGVSVAKWAKRGVGKEFVAAVPQGMWLTGIRAGQRGPWCHCWVGLSGGICVLMGCAVTLPWHHW